MMDLFDLHCDTAFECATKLDGADIAKGGGIFRWNAERYFAKYIFEE